MNLPKRLLPYSPIHRVLVLVTAMLLGGATAQAQVAGRFLLLNPQTGAYLVGGIDVSGYFHSAWGGTRASLKGLTNLAANNMALIAYNSPTGYSEFVVIDGYGQLRFTPQQFSAGANIVQGSGNNFLFYYGNANQSGSGSFITVGEGGYYQKTLENASLSPWSNVVQTDDYLCFYNYKTGLFAQTTLSPVNQALIENNYSVVTLPANFNVFAAVNDNLIVYNSGTGAYEIQGLLYKGNGNDAPILRSSGTLKTYYGAILPTAGQVVFYGYGTGDALTASISQSGLLQQENDITLPLYTGVMTTGSYVVFYDAVGGNLDVYGVTPAGALTLRSTQPIGAGYTFMTATQS